MIVFPLARSVGLKAATASSSTSRKVFALLVSVPSLIFDKEFRKLPL